VRPTPPSARTLLAALPLFKSLDRATLERLAGAALRLALKRGDRVFSTGDPVTGMYVLVYGKVRLMAHGPRGRRLTSVVEAGASFAEPMMFLEQPAIVDAEAVSDALVLHVPKQAIFDELDRNPLFARRIIAALCERVHGLVRDAERHAISNGRERLIQYLARNARDEADGAIVDLPGPKAVVAAHLHLTAEHFSRLLHELASEGLIQVRARRIAIPALAKLIGGTGAHASAAKTPRAGGAVISGPARRSRSTPRRE
jgi:CRP/FNR family transcriptional regulator, dissimilatory nitrate respiration regulator